ncbi:hypothetical protein [Prevotella fusca]|uniref:hypothetical protein n=1 Tax=Prevotella fusca TaxID=589436 RepID=UPI0004681E90|nr:hypothetical protein [Prevotella fusca]
MIDFKIWIDKHIGIFDENIHGLFIDSYKCFTNDIERPAYLLAYQGLMQYIRTLILNSSLTPHGFTAQEWENNFLKNLEMMEHGIKKFLIVLNSQTLTLEKDLF